MESCDRKKRGRKLNGGYRDFHMVSAIISLLFLKLFHRVSWAHGKLFSHKTVLEKSILAMVGLPVLKDFIHMSRQVNVKLTILLHKNQALNLFTFFFITPNIS